ncbi:MAG: hypothetical protein CFE24_03925 [Flavobacterium sp. BFFFF2]|nr:MAG: hypothetical protein CFE24_03925 [Flavobacterium sp. BFFFF2]
MRKSVFSWGGVFLLLLFLTGCTKDLYDDTVREEQLKHYVAKLSDLPMVQQHVQRQKMKRAANRDAGIDYWSLINLDKVIVLEDKEGLQSFTFYVNLPDTNKLTNLVVKEKIDGSYEEYLFEYISNDLQQWLQDNRE